MDANTLMDYIQVDSTILKLVATYIAPINIPSPMLEVAKSLNESDLTGLGLRVIEPTLEQVIEATPSH